ncbi:FecR domain-containing protein [Aeoliella mucimassa]|uniref:FecR protein n=1 Tax=Aeoliella mucimassa TaxID=2527972 RepID=A0A518AQ67_9BACT|nr:FecR domain-containing protein [Aeoliella mucimassa]QDU56862.1 FecR protein [Aeoliella mucimassa]
MESNQHNPAAGNSDERMLDLALRGQLEELSPEEFAALEEKLRTDPQALASYVKHVADTVSIGQLVSPEGKLDHANEAATIAGAGERPHELRPLGPSDHPRARYIGSMLAASLITFLLSWVAFKGAGDPQPITQADPGATNPTESIRELDFVATLTGAVDCQWAGYLEGPKYGEPLESGREVALISGLAQLTFDDGAKVVLQGPATFRVEGTGAASLTAGKMTALVPRQAVGFRIQTPTAEIVDLGTEFGLEVNAQGKTEVHVFTGEVVVWDREPNSQSTTGVRLEQQEAALLGEGKILPIPVDYDDSKFAFRDFSPRLSAEELPAMSVTHDLALWLAADVLLKTDDSGRVIAWRDIATGDNQTEEDAWQHSPESRPEYVRKSIGGLPSVRFDGKSSYLTTTPLYSTEDQTLFLLFARDSTPSGRYLRQLINYNGPPYPLDNEELMRVLQIGDQDVDGQYWARYFAGVGEGNLIYNVGSTTMKRPAEPGEPILLAYRYDTVHNETKMWINGELQQVDTAPRWRSYTSRKVIGRHPRQDYFSGDISEVLIYNGVLENEEVDEVTAYLTKKYSLN